MPPRRTTTRKGGGADRFRVVRVGHPLHVGISGTEDVVIREALDSDLPAIVDLQNALLSTAAIEWTETPHTVLERAEWLRRQRTLRNPVLVAIVGHELVGWCTFGDFRDTTTWPGYQHTVEHTIHVREDKWGSGVGRLLMSRLLDAATSLHKHVMVGAVTGENEASIRFHERLGFVEVARMPQVGAKFGRWLDLVLLQKRLDERAAPDDLTTGRPGENGPGAALR